MQHKDSSFTARMVVMAVLILSVAGMLIGVVGMFSIMAALERMPGWPLALMSLSVVALLGVAAWGGYHRRRHRG